MQSIPKIIFRKSILKQLFLVVFSLQFLVVFSQGNWERKDIPTTRDLNALHFIDSLTGWVVGDSGTILHTVDGGDSWYFQESHTSNEIVDVFFLNANLGWASSHHFDELPYGTELLKTADGGENWIKYDYPEDNVFINAIFYLDSLTGWMGGSPHAIVKTSDGGLTWKQADVDTSVLAFFPVINIKFYNDQYGYASGGIFDIAGVTWRTDNGGEKWYAIKPSDAPADEVHGLYLFDSVTVTGSGGDPDFGYGVGMLHTEDGGLNWNYEEPGILGIAYDLDYRNESEAWSPLGHRQKMIFSLDGGSTWTETNTPDSTAIYKLMFTDSTHGYGVGRDGAFISYIPPDPVHISERTTDQTLDFDIYNFPNPFYEQTIISIKLDDSFHQNIPGLYQLCLLITNSKGETIAQHDLPPEKGNHQITFEASGLPAGLYYYFLTVKRPGMAAETITARKMIHMK